MAGKEQAVNNGEELKKAVVAIGSSLGLEVETEKKVGRRVWGAERKIDVILRHSATSQVLGIECKFQGTPGSAEEKIPATIADIAAWPIRGMVVVSGSGFSANIRGYLLSTGMVVDLEDLADWLTLYFVL